MMYVSDDSEANDRGVLTVARSGVGGTSLEGVEVLEWLPSIRYIEFRVNGAVTKFHYGMDDSVMLVTTPRDPAEQAPQAPQAPRSTLVNGVEVIV